MPLCQDLAMPASTVGRQRLSRLSATVVDYAGQAVSKVKFAQIVWHRTSLERYDGGYDRQRTYHTGGRENVHPAFKYGGRSALRGAAPRFPPFRSHAGRRWNVDARQGDPIPFESAPASGLTARIVKLALRSRTASRLTLSSKTTLVWIRDDFDLR